MPLSKIIDKENNSSPELLKTQEGSKETSIRKFTKIIFKFFFFSFLGISLAFVISEIFVRLFIPVSDAPDVKFNPLLGNVFISNQQGFYIKGENIEIKGRFRINKEGWNSPHEYTEVKSPNIYRVVVIGDSFIEALQVDYDKSYPYLMEKYLNEGGWSNKKVEVYTFGHSGANLVHYGYILDFAAKKYKPDLAIINIVSNDFKESLWGFSRKDNWSLSYSEGNFRDEPPRLISNLNIKRFIRNSALVRYLAINLDLVNTSPLINRVFNFETRRYDTTDKIQEDFFAKDWFLKGIIKKTLNHFLEIRKANNSKIILVLDADRNAIYSGKNLEETENYKFMSAIKQVAQELNIPVVDLANSFKTAWNEKKERFDWSIDEHWNQYGHQIVADTLTNFLRSDFGK